MEEMKRIKGFEGYSVTKDGRVFSHKTNKFLTPFKRDTYGYLAVNLVYAPKKFKTCNVHVIVLEAFSGDRPDGLVAAHLDGNRTNNHASNLAWVTQKENIGHKKDHGTLNCGERNGNHSLTEDQVKEIRRNAGDVSFAEMARQFKVSEFAVACAAKGKTWRHV